MDDDTLKNAVAYSCTYNDSDAPIVWKIYGDNKYINHDATYTRIKNSSTLDVSHIDFQQKEIHETFGRI